MPEEQQQQPEEAPDQQPEPQPQEGEPGKAFDAEYVEKLRKENAKYRTEAKQNAAAAKRLQEIEESQKTEQQRLLERAEAAERERDQERALRQVNDWKAKVSKDTGLPADVLRGSDLEEIEAHAASLKALLPEPRTPGYVPTEGRTVTGGTGNPAQQFASILKQQLAP